MTLYLDVELSRDSRPGTEQKTSVGFDTMPSRDSFWKGRPSELPLGRVTGPGWCENKHCWSVEEPEKIFKIFLKIFKIFFLSG